MSKSDKIRLRAVEPTDADFMYDVENDREAWRYGDTIAPLSRRMLRDYATSYDADPFSAGQLRLIIAEKKSGKPVGIVDLYDISRIHRRAFAGIYICRDSRCRGFAYEAIKEVCDYACNNLLLHKISAKTEAGNMKSIGLFRKAGFEEEAILKDWFATPDGHFTHLHILSLTL